MFADKLRELRLRKGLSRQALADWMGVTVSAVQKWEKGQSQPDIAALRKLADLFCVSLDVLCDHAPETVPDGGDEKTIANMTVMARAFRQLTAEEQEKYLAVGRALFAEAFKSGGGKA